MQAVFNKIPIDNCWSSRRSTCVINRAAIVAEIHTLSHAWHADASVVSRLSQMILQKCLKMQHIFAYNRLFRGAAAATP